MSVFSSIQEERKKIYDKSTEESIQPYIIIVGTIKEIEASYVIINNQCIYKLNSFVEAVDVLYKLSKVNYKLSCRNIKQTLQFLDYVIFDIDKENVYTSVTKLISKMKIIE